MGNPSIIVVEDEEDILELITYNLIKAKFQVLGASSGEEALELIEKNKPDLVLLDLMLPGIDGFEVCTRLRESEEFKNIPVIMLTARGEENMIVKGLEIGADDYVTKPFSPKVLIARINNVLNRQDQKTIKEDGVIKVFNIEIDSGRHAVSINGELIDLTLTEFKILHSLASKPGWVFTRYQIVDKVHGANHIVTDRSIDFQIVGLRKKMGESGAYIETVRGVGYRFKD